MLVFIHFLLGVLKLKIKAIYFTFPSFLKKKKGHKEIFLERFIYLFERESERACEWGEREKESKADSILSTEPDVGLDLIHDPETLVEVSKNQELNA